MKFYCKTKQLTIVTGPLQRILNLNFDQWAIKLNIKLGKKFKKKFFQKILKNKMKIDFQSHFLRSFSLEKKLLDMFWGSFRGQKTYSEIKKIYGSGP